MNTTSSPRPSVSQKKSQASRLLAAGICAATLFTAPLASAASIAFQSPTAITDDTILDAALAFNDATLVQAVSFGLTATVTTAQQTITFTAGADRGDFNLPASSSTLAGIYNGNTQNDTYSGTTGDTNFDTVLGSNAWHNDASDNTQPLGLRIGGLTEGQTYVVYLFTVDDRAGSAGRAQAYWDGFSSGPTFSGNTSGSFSQNTPISVAGTFTADSSGYQDIFIQETDGGGNDDTHLAAYTLYSIAIPEPSTYASIAGALALGAVVLRRRRMSV